jgi:DNA-binding SARP family transcriptional activator/tetratricopeptide (TPR) repeat protein
MELRVRVLGGFEIEGFGAHQLGSRKARTLLKVLALARGRPVAVDELIERLWPDEEQSPSRPDEQVAVLVSRLRAVLGPDRLIRTDAGHSLRYDWLDVAELGELAEEAGRRLSAGSFALARAAADAALALVRGPVLADEPDAPWVTGERVAAERLIAQIRLCAVTAALNAGEYATAAHLASAIVDRNPYDEAALRALMEAHALMARPALAVAAYGALRERLSEELGMDPAPQTESIYLRILRQQPPRGDDDGLAQTGQSLGAVPSAVAGRDRLPRRALAGRERELAVLDAALERAAAGGAELVVVEGEAGIGKSRLLQTWAAIARATGVLVLEARCDELERSLPLQPLADALDAHLRTLPTSEAVLGVLGSEHSLLATLLRASPPSTQPASVDPVGGQAALFAAILAVFERLAARAPVALLLDDLHLADRATLAWLHFAARRSTVARLLLLGSVRSDESALLPRARRLVLGPLDLAAAREVVGAERAAELHARSGGHPLFLVELATAEGGALPTSLRGAIAARCLSAGSDAATTLHAAALLGATVDFNLLASMLKAPPLELLGHLEEGVRRGLLEERASTFGFRHELVREALSADVTEARRMILHREAAHALADRPSAQPLEVAYHARLGGDIELAAGAYANAATQAAERYDHVESERLLNLAVELSDSPARRVQRARTRLLRGDYPGAEEDALRAVESGAGASALEVAGWAAYYRRDFEAAQRFADSGARLGVGAVHASSLALGGRARHSNGDLAEAEAKLEEALAHAENPAAAVAPAVYLGFLRTHQGRARETLDLVGPATRGLHTPDLQMVTITAHMATVHALASLGKASAALQAIQAWEDEMQRQGASRFKGRPANYRAWVLRGLGNLEQADEFNWRALDEARGLGTREAEAHALLDLADGKLRIGQLDSATAHLADAAPLQEQSHANRWRHWLRYRLLNGRLALARGSADEAQTIARQVMVDAERMGVVRYVDLAFLLEAEAALVLGQPLEHDAVSSVLERLPEHSGLEAWWLAAGIGDAASDNHFRDLADIYAERLATQAGDYEETFRHYAGARLERISTIGRHG